MGVKEIAEKYIQADKQAFQEGYFDALEQIYAPDIVIHSAQNPDSIGFEANKEYIQKVRENVSDLHQEFEFITGDGNVFAISYKATFTPKVDIPIAPAGSTVNIDSLFVLRCENDKIAEIWMKGNTTLS
ncbi:MAG: nuclear transport factor 2 family protein [Dehalococcoidia bacterium]|nr:MAG: nuclear transport factor 2 family protein [Dehalococcoidia bacterium]